MSAITTTRTSLRASRRPTGRDSEGVPTTIACCISLPQRVRTVLVGVLHAGGGFSEDGGTQLGGERPREVSGETSHEGATLAIARAMLALGVSCRAGCQGIAERSVRLSLPLRGCAGVRRETTLVATVSGDDHRAGVQIQHFAGARRR